MLDAEKIRNEPDPFIREIYSLGYDEIAVVPMDDKIYLYKGGEKSKEINLKEFQMCVYGCKTITCRTYFGTTHEWIKEADGSAEKFRKFISG